ncbi:MAG: ribosomal-processing cysteine protease Prp [Faecalibacterium sp.]|nr:ribosomal-processing cysteine protease Prp [Faecalibacterium sp.]
MMKVVYSEMDTPAGISCRLEAVGHAGYAPAGQDIVCAGASTVMQGLVCLLAGEESARSDAFDEPDGPRLAVQADAPCAEWVQGAFELAKACFALLAERYPENVRFADVSRRGEKSMMDLQLFAAAEATAACGGNREPRLGQRPAEHECRSRHEVGAGSRNPWGTFMLQLFAEGDAAPAPPALSEAQTRQAVASGTMKPGEAAPAVPAAPQPEPEARPEPPVQRPELPLLSGLARSTRTAVQGLHARWAAEEAAMRRSQPDFNLQKELRSPEMRRLMQLPGMRVQDAYRLTHYDENLRTAAQAVEQGVVERIQQRAARPTENGIRPGGAATVRPDVASMTRAQREALERRVLHGAQIEL